MKDKPDRLHLEQGHEETKPHAPWPVRFAAIGIILPIICLALDFKPVVLTKACQLCWPSSFLLLATEGHFNPAITLLSIMINAFLWAGFGWLIGFGLSNRDPK